MDCDWVHSFLTLQICAILLEYRKYFEMQAWLESEKKEGSGLVKNIIFLSVKRYDS